MVNLVAGEKYPTMAELSPGGFLCRYSPPRLAASQALS